MFVKDPAHCRYKTYAHKSRQFFFIIHVSTTNARLCASTHSCFSLINFFQLGVRIRGAGAGEQEECGSRAYAGSVRNKNLRPCDRNAIRPRQSSGGSSGSCGLERRKQKERRNQTGREVGSMKPSMGRVSAAQVWGSLSTKMPIASSSVQRSLVIPKECWVMTDNKSPARR